MKSHLCTAVLLLLSLALLGPQAMALDDVEVDPATLRVKSLVSGYPVGEIAIAGRLYIDLHAHFMAARTEETGHVLNWYNLGYSGGDGASGEQGGTFGNFGLDVPWQERTLHYPLWSPAGDIPAIRFSGSQFIKADFPAESDITGNQTVTIELWVLHGTPTSGEVILGWQAEDGSASSAPFSWPSDVGGSSQWRHIAVVADGAAERWYVDGALALEGARHMVIQEGHRLVLGGASEHAPSFRGHIAAVRVHRRAMDAAAVARNASGGVMRGTTLTPNIDPNADPEDGYFYDTWGDANPEDYFMETSTHFRYRIPYSRLEAMSEADRMAHDGRIEGMFEMSEACYHAYAHIHALRMPLVSRRARYRGDGVRYMTNIFPTDGANYMGWHDELGFGYPMQGAGHMNPHELVHGVQAQTGGGMQGNYWEVHANFPQTWAGIWQTNPSWLELRDQSLFEATGRSYYHARLMMHHLAQTPQYGPMFISKLWYSGDGRVYPWITFNRFNPDPESSLGYEWARMVQRNITWDYIIHPRTAPGNPVPDDYLLSDILHNEELMMRHGRVLLHEIPYMPGWYRPAKNYAPQQTGWNLVPLTAEGGLVTVELEGYMNPERGGDWHYGFVAVDSAGESRYGDIRSTSGPLSFATQPGDQELFFIVAAIPTNIMPIDMTGDVRMPEQEPFPYRVRFTGASPRNVVVEYYDNKFGAVSGAPHPNGGGFAASTATVAGTAYVGPDARVVGNSTVSGYARIEDYAIVEDATVQDYAVVSDFALVQGNAIVKDHARVRDFGRVAGGSTLASHARVLEHATLHSGRTTSDRVTLKGHANQHGGDASGTAMIDGHYTKRNDITNGRWLSWSWGSGRNPGETGEDFGGLYADYVFSEAHPWMARDVFSLTWGYLVGDPAFVPLDDAVTIFRYTSGPGTEPGADPTEASAIVPLDGIVNVPVPGWITVQAWTEGLDPSPVVTYVYQNEDSPDDLLFSLDHQDLPPAGVRADEWGDFLRVVGEAPVALIDGVKWYHNDMGDEGDFRHPMLRHRNEVFTEPIPIDGATIVTAVKPVRNSWGTSWTSIVDIFYNQLSLGIRNDTGRVMVRVSEDEKNHLWVAPEATAIPDGEAGILSLAVTHTGAFTVYWMNGSGVERVIGTGQGNTPNGYTALTPGTNNREFTRYINVGRNNPDSWSTYSGYIGDTYVFKRTLSHAERAALVEQTRVSMLAYTPDAGQSIPPNVSRLGDTPLPDPVQVKVSFGEHVEHVLEFNGVDQFVELPRDIAGFRTATYTAEVKWAGGAGARIFEFSGANGDAVWLSPSENGNMVFAIRKGHEVQQVTAPALSIGVWTTVQVVIGDQGATLFVDGAMVAENRSMTLRPESARATACYLGRGVAGNFFNGQIARFTVYSVALGQISIEPPDAPASISYPASSGTGHYTVSWEASAGATEYVLERSVDGGASWTHQFTGSALSHAETAGDGRYRYRVRAVNAVGTSNWRTGGHDCVVTLPVLETVITRPASDTVSIDDDAVRLRLIAEATVDGAPSGNVSYAWSATRADGSATFEYTNHADTSVTLNGRGMYVLRVTSTLNAATATGEVTVTLNGADGSGSMDEISLWYRFDETSGTQAADASGHNRHAALINGPVWTAAGKVNGALNFDGVDDYVRSPEIAVASDTGWTATAWVNRTGASGVQNIILCQEGGVGRIWLSVRTNGEVFAMLGGIGILGGNVTMGNWHHVAISIGAGTNPTRRLYVDGVEVAASERTIEAVTQPFRVGAHKNLTSSSDHPWQGTIDELRLYRRELSAAEIARAASKATHNNAPLVSAGADRSGSVGSPVSIDGAVLDDGRPLPQPAIQWTKYSGPGAVVFEDPSQPQTTVTFDAAGTYVLRLSAFDGEVEVFDEMTCHAMTISEMDLWRQEQFGDDAGDDAIAGPLADPNQHGVVNLLKFALRGDPHVDDAAVILPRMEMNAGGDDPVFVFRVRGEGNFDGGGGYAVDGIVYRVDTAEVPGAVIWQPLTLSDVNAAFSDDAGGPSLRIALDAEAYGHKIFVRLRVRAD